MQELLWRLENLLLGKAQITFVYPLQQYINYISFHYYHKQI